MKIDTHIHTIASGHANGTIFEISKEAIKKQLDLICLTDHAPKVIGSASSSYFRNIKRFTHYPKNLEILFGAELNILDLTGKLDLEEDIIKNLDVCIASFHSICYKSENISYNTTAMVNAIKNLNINIIGHPEDNKFPVDYKKIVFAAKEYRVLLEVNNISCTSGSYRSGGINNLKEILKLCSENKVPVSVGSDAHKVFDVGNLNNSIKLLEEINFPKNLITNYDKDYFKSFLNKK